MTDDPGRRETPDDLLDRHLMASIRLGLALGRGLGTEAAIGEYLKGLAWLCPADVCWCHNSPDAECGCGGPQGDEHETR